MLGGVSVALALVIMSNNRPPAANLLPPSESQERLEAVARRLLEAQTSSNAASGGKPKEETPIAGPTVALADVTKEEPEGLGPRAPSAEPARLVSRPAPTPPSGGDGDSLKGSCGEWFNCEPISEEGK